MKQYIVEFQPAYVLHARPYRDTSLLLELLTRDYGRISAVARGVRQARSRYRGVLQMFMPLLISWSGKSELHTLRHVESQGIIYSLMGNKILSGLYANELLIRLVHRYDPCPMIYEAYALLLANLASAENEEKFLRLFEKQLLSELGYAFSLTHDCKTTESIIAENFYVFEPARGLTKATRETPGVFPGESLLALATDRLDTRDILRDAKRLLRQSIAILLGEKPIKSRELFII